MKEDSQESERFMKLPSFIAQPKPVLSSLGLNPREPPGRKKDEAKIKNLVLIATVSLIKVRMP